MDIPVVPKVGKRKVKEILGATSILIILVGIIIFPWTDAYHQIGTYDWEEVPATVSISEVREIYRDCGGENTGIQDASSYIAYTYEVKGMSYYNDDIVLEKDWTVCGGFGFSTSLVDEYPYGSQTTAYYNSEDPNQAVLMKGFSGVLPLIVYLLGIIIWVYVAVVTFLIVWKILFHIQPATNREKAEQKYADDEDDERHEREMYSKLRKANKNKSTNLERNDSVTLRDFPVSNWDSENDAQEIVDWYNRKSGEDKTVSDFMELCEVTKFDSRNDAQKLLDAAMLFLETINQQEESRENRSEEWW